MKFTELPSEKQYYTLVLSNKSEYSITGPTKEAIMASKSQFVELDRGDIINKAHILEIRADLETTKHLIRALPQESLQLLENHE